jgi:hypothetical protein
MEGNAIDVASQARVAAFNEVIEILNKLHALARDVEAEVGAVPTAFEALEDA